MPGPTPPPHGSGVDADGRATAPAAVDADPPAVPTGAAARPAAPRWWGETTVPTDEARRWVLGPTRLWFVRRPHEWLVSSGASDTAADAGLDASVEADVAEASAAVPDDATTMRFSFGATEPRLRLAPRLADRPVVVRPDTPFYVPAGEEARLFVSTPLWVRVSVGTKDTFLIELPSHRLSDTWFGPNTLDGELCFAARTSARLELASLPRRAHRAVTPVVVRNRAAEPLLLDRLKVPVGLLSLFADDSGAVWTERVTLVREQDGDLAAIQLDRGAPREALAAGGAAPVPLAGPRQATESRLTLRAFTRLFRS